MRRSSLFLILVVTLAGCRPSAPLVVTNVQVGRSLNSDDSVGNLTTRFKPDDTIYVSALTETPGTSTITARWFYQGTLVNESSRDVSYNNEGATEFHLINTNGFPAGSYRVDILVDGQQVESRTFTVEN